MATTVETIKERLSINEVVASYIKIEKAGVNFKAKCPFHNEKTPSFFISPARNTFYCFGCGAKGDIFEFVQKFEGLDFPGALKVLAEKANVPIVFEKAGERDSREKLFATLEDAIKYFESNLDITPKAKEYLLERGLTEETIKKFRLGYSLPEWRALSLHLKDKGHDGDSIEKAGLSKPGNQGQYDRFRGRIMFPIFDSSGRGVAFSGRIFDKSLEGEDSTPGKYINSPETALYHKSKILYGFDKAKEGIRKWTFVIVVEGQMDLLLCHQATYNNTVAISGTALTSEQLTMIKHLTERLVLSLDADAAGLSASGKSAALALQEGFDVKVAHIIGGKDPADIIKENPNEWKEIIKTAKHVIEFYLDVLSDRTKDERAYRLLVTKTVLPYVKMIQSAIDRAHFVSLIAERLKVPVSAIEEELGKVALEKRERAELGEIETNTPSLLTRHDLIIKYLLGLIESNKGNDEFTTKVLTDLKEKVGTEEIERLYRNIDFINEAAFAVEEMKISRPPDEIASELILNLTYEIIKSKSVKLKQEISEKEKEGRDKEVQELMKNYQKVSKEFAEIEQKLKQNGFSKSN
ncbi:MAG: DNA primase [bacterium]|nr:DNA primase [bacterium]